MQTSLRTQIVLVVTVVLMAAMGVYLALATRIVTADKEATVYDVNALVAGTVAGQVESSIEGIADKLRYFGQEYLTTPGDAERRARSLLGADTDVLSVEVWKPAEGSFERTFLFVDPQRLSALNLSAEDLRRARKDSPVPLDAVVANGVILQNASLVPDLALLRLSTAAPNGAVVIADLRPEWLLKVARVGTVYRVFVVDSLGRVLAHPDSRKVLTHADLSANEVVKDALAEKVARGAREYEADGQRLFAAFARVENAHAAVVVEVPRDEVFRATRELTQRSVLFGVGAVSLAMLLAIWLTRRLARPLRELQDTMAHVSRGEYGAVVPVGGPSEIRAVGAAFNEMSRALSQSQDELQSTNAQLVQSEKLSAVGELAASVVHEVKNPMVGIVGFAQLGQESTEAKEMQEYFHLIEQDAQRANTILVNLLEFSRPPDVDAEELEVSEVVRGALRLTKHQMQMMGTRVDTVFGEGLGQIRGNDNQLRQVMVNLFINAAQAMRQSATKVVTVTTSSAPDGGVVVRVADTGPGMDEETRQRVFKPFFTTKRRGEGTGLGLSVSKGIIETHRGRIAVESEAGKGATFVITFPNKSVVPQRLTDG